MDSYIMSENSWRTYLQALPQNADGNKNLAAFAAVSNGATPVLERVRGFMEDQDAVLIAVSQLKDKMRILHSPHNFGGTRSRPSDKCVFLEGRGPQALPLLASMESLKETVKVDVPTLATLRTISNKADLLSATPQGRTAQSLDTAILMVLPPFVAKVFLEIQDLSPASLFVELLSAVSSFDNDHAEDDCYQPAEASCKDLLSYLWAAAHGKMPAMNLMSDAEDNEMSEWSKHRHNACIMSGEEVPRSAVDNSDLLQQLSTNVQSQTNWLEKNRQDREALAGEKKDKFEDLAEPTKNLILNASSRNGEVTPMSPCESCKDFFSKSSVGKAQQFFLHILSVKYKCLVEVKTGTVTALHGGVFLRDRDDSPSNFTLMAFAKRKPLSPHPAKKCMTLRLKVSQGKGWSDHDIADALKQGIETPQSIEELGHAIKNSAGAAAFFFSTESTLVTRLKEVNDEITNKLLIWEAAQERDPTFATRVMCAMDTRVCRWLLECKAAEDREVVDDGLIDFAPLMRQIALDQFHQPLPVSIQVVTERQVTPSKRKAGGGRGVPDATNNAVNTKPIKEWKLQEGESFKKVFAGKNVDKRPKLNGVNMCARFHTRGNCFPDCRSAPSHVPSQEVPAEQKKAYAAFCKLCRGE